MKKIILTFIAIAAVLIFIMPVMGEGILEQNGYDLYYGKSKSFVKLMQPQMVDFDNGLFLVDYTEDFKNNEIYLFVTFDKSNNVDQIVVIISDYGDFITSGDPYEGLSVGLKILGIDAHSVIDVSEENNTISALTSDNIFCISQKLVHADGQNTYTTSCQSYSDNTSTNQKDDDTLIIGCFEQDNNFRNDCEPIEWSIIARKGDKALLISKYVLENMPITDREHNDKWQMWETSILRNWLNTDFLQESFSEEEQQRILQVTNKNPINPEYKTREIKDTEDRIFLLSVEEVLTYFPDKESRLCEQTPYAASHCDTQYARKMKYSYWWTRTSGYTGSQFNTAVSVGNSDIFYYGNDGWALDGVRPAFWYDMSGLE